MDKLKTWAPWDSIEKSAQEQLQKTAALPWIFRHVAVMPDVHWGVGATVGSVIAMKNALAPAAVGVDLGCGMLACRVNLDRDYLSDQNIYDAIERAIPTGFNAHAESVSAGELSPALAENVSALYRRASDFAAPGLDLVRMACQLGTLGGGNHFIELCVDENDEVWLFLHSGSRGIGNRLAQHHIEVARKLAHNADLPDPDLAVFLAGTPEMEVYRRDLLWAQSYAANNRRVMMELILTRLADVGERQNAIGLAYETLVGCHHNYVSEETHFGEDVIVTRKGAISARAGELGLIPGSMGARSYIVRGLGNPESFHSASHGAGRVMSRGAARRTFTAVDVVKQTAGVTCRKDDSVVDEIPAAYKDIDLVMNQQKDLVEVVHTLKQFVCVKGEEKKR